MKFPVILFDALKKLGFRRAILFAIALITFSGVLMTSMYMFNKPARTVLYSGLTPDDVSQIGSVLSEAGVAFDINESGNAVLVDYGKTSQARMILAEKGLPKSGKSGYQLFDQMGSLGLTSFMQQVTRARALEGELVRTIQQLDGIKTARVHLALKPDNGFATKSEKSTASVVIRTVGRPTEQTIRSVRLMVSAAIPGMTPDAVTVMTTDGTMLDGGKSANSGADHLQELERSVSDGTAERIERTVSPMVGMNNVRVSVTTALNIDKKQVQETNFDPESKVERSLRSLKTSDQSNDSSSSQNVSADQNIPQEVKSSGSPDQTNKKKESKEETINYEVNSKQVATTTDGYRVEKQSLAVVINRQALMKLQGQQPDEKKLSAQMAEIESIVKSSSGFDEKRGDQVHVTAVDFTAEDAALEPLPGPSMAELLKGHMGTIINAGALIISVTLLLLLGLKPAMKFLTEVGKEPDAPAADMAALPPGDTPQLATGNVPAGSEKPGSPFGPIPSNDILRQQLNHVVGGDINRSAQVIKQWMDSGANKAA